MACSRVNFTFLPFTFASFLVLLHVLIQIVTEHLGNNYFTKICLKIFFFLKK